VPDPVPGPGEVLVRVIHQRQSHRLQDPTGSDEGPHASTVSGNSGARRCRRG
jgi:hypothetical protein